MSTLKPFPVINKNYLLNSRIMNSGILMDYPAYQTAIKKFNDITCWCRLFITKWYFYLLIVDFKKRYDTSGIEEFTQDKRYKILDYIGLGNIGNPGKLAKDLFFNFIKYEGETPIVKSEVINELFSKEVATKAIEYLMKQTSGKNKTAVRALVRKLSIFKAFYAIVGKELDFSIIEVFNEKFNKPRLSKILPKLMAANPEIKIPVDLFKKINFKKTLIDAVKIEKVNPIIEKYFLNIGEIKAYLVNKANFERFSEMEDYNILDPIDENTTLTYDNRVLKGYDEICKVSYQYVNFNAPEFKQHLYTLIKRHTRDYYTKIVSTIMYYDKLKYAGKKPPPMGEIYQNFDEFITKEEQADFYEKAWKKEAKNLCGTMAVFDKIYLKYGNAIHIGHEEFDSKCIADFAACIRINNSIIKQMTGYFLGQIPKALCSFQKYDENFMYVKGKSDNPNNKIYTPFYDICGKATKRSASGIHTFPPGSDSFRSFIPEKDCYALYFDISALEVRFAAYTSGDKNLIALFDAGKDPYIYLSQKMYPKLAPDDPSHRAKRPLFKTILLGLLYGRGAGSIASQTGGDIKEVRQFVKMFEKEFPQLHKFIEAKKKYCADTGFIETFFNDKLHGNKDRAMTVGINYYCQNGASLVAGCGFENFIQRGMDYGVVTSPKIWVHDSITVTTYFKDFMDILFLIRSQFTDFIKDTYKINLKFEVILLIDFRDKIHLNYDIDKGDFTIDGRTDHVKLFVENLKPYYNVTVVEEKELSKDESVLDNAIRTWNISTKTWYPENNFIIPGNSKIHFTLERKTKSLLPDEYLHSEP